MAGVGPATWEGWFVTVIYACLIIAAAFTIDETSSRREIFFAFVILFIILTTAFIRIAYKKGEKPRWQWGTRKE